jgi:hypothetical protein
MPTAAFAAQAGQTPSGLFAGMTIAGSPSAGPTGARAGGATAVPPTQADASGRHQTGAPSTSSRGVHAAMAPPQQPQPQAPPPAWSPLQQSSQRFGWPPRSGTLSVPPGQPGSASPLGQPWPTPWGQQVAAAGPQPDMWPQVAAPGGPSEQSGRHVWGTPSSGQAPAPGPTQHPNEWHGNMPAQPPPQQHWGGIGGHGQQWSPGYGAASTSQPQGWGQWPGYSSGAAAHVHQRPLGGQQWSPAHAPPPGHGQQHVGAHQGYQGPAGYGNGAYTPPGQPVAWNHAGPGYAHPVSAGQPGVGDMFAGMNVRGNGTQPSPSV